MTDTLYIESKIPHHDHPWSLCHKFCRSCWMVLFLSFGGSVLQWFLQLLWLEDHCWLHCCYWDLQKLTLSVLRFFFGGPQKTAVEQASHSQILRCHLLYAVLQDDRHLQAVHLWRKGRFLRLWSHCKCSVWSYFLGKPTWILGKKSRLEGFLPFTCRKSLTTFLQFAFMGPKTETSRGWSRCVVWAGKVRNTSAFSSLNFIASTDTWLAWESNRTIWGLAGGIHSTKNLRNWRNMSDSIHPFAETVTIEFGGVFPLSSSASRWPLKIIR